MKKENKFKEKAESLIEFCKQRVLDLEKQIGANSEIEEDEIEEDEIEDKILDSLFIEKDKISQ